MAYNQRFNGNDEKYDPEATEALQKVINESQSVAESFQQMKKEIRQGADPRVLLTQTSRGMYAGIPPINTFAAKGEADFLQELFAMGIEPTSDILTAAIKGSASPAKKVNTVTAILDEKPDLVHEHIKDFGKTSTPLIIAIKEDLPAALIEVLLKHGANPDLQDQDGMTALMYASESRRDVVELLLRYGAEPHLENKNGLIARNYNSYSQMSNLLPSRNGGRRKTRRSKPQPKKSKKTKSRRRH